jgi:hypothetical protein
MVRSNSFHRGWGGPDLDRHCYRPSLITRGRLFRREFGQAKERDREG